MLSNIAAAFSSVVDIVPCHQTFDRAWLMLNEELPDLSALLFNQIFE
jgi:hypothetical protein